MVDAKWLHERFTLIEGIIFYLMIGCSISILIGMFGYLGFNNITEGVKNPDDLCIECLLVQMCIHILFFIKNMYHLFGNRVPREIPKNKIIYFMVAIVSAILFIAATLAISTNGHYDIFWSPDDTGGMFALTVSLIINIAYVRKINQSLGMNWANLQTLWK